MRRSPLLSLVVLASLSAGCLGGLGEAPTGQRLDFEVTTLEGETVSAESLRGKVVVLDLMATWCGPCKGEMPHLAEFWEAHEASGDVALLSLSVDDSGDERDALPEWRERHGGTWPFAIDEGQRVQRDTGARGIPTLVIVDADGVVRERLSDYPVTAEALSERVAAYLPAEEA